MTNETQELLELYNDKYTPRNPLTEHITDKNFCHTYIEDVYSNEFRPFKKKYIHLLEIGVSHSGSIRLWRDFFENGQIYGIDPFLDNAEAREASSSLITNPQDRIKIIVGDAYTFEIVENLPQFDFIIDDGPHTIESQIKCVQLYLPKLKKDGVLFIEDININFNHCLENDGLADHPVIKQILEHVPTGKYVYKIFDLRLNAIGREHSEAKGRGDNVILKIQPI